MPRILVINIHMIILKDKSKIFLTINADSEVTVSSTVPETGISFEFDSLSNRDYAKALNLVKKVQRSVAEYGEVGEDELSMLVDYVHSKVVAVHNTKYTKDNFMFDTYFPFLHHLLKESILSDEEKDFLP